MSKLKEKNIKMTIFIIVVGVSLIVMGIYGVVSSRIESRDYKNSTDIQKISSVIIDFLTSNSIQHINLRFHMLLTEKPIRENVKSVSGQATTQKNMPMIN